MHSRLVLACRAVAWRRLVLALALGSAQAAPNEQQEIQELYRRGLTGDKEAVVQCIGRLETALRTRPRDQIARVYLGSSYTLRSRDLGFGPKKLSTLKEGLAIMDEAVTAAPDNPKVRLVRALTTAALPSIFGRGGSSRKDFDLLAETALRTPERFEAGDLQIIFYRAALSAKAAGDRTRTRTLLEAAARHPADAKLSATIALELAALR